MAVVAGWNVSTPDATRGNVVPKDFYTNVLGPSCRTCHNSRTSTAIRFDDITTFTNRGDQDGSIDFAVCQGVPAAPPLAPSGSTTPTKYMPNSKVTFINFWTSENPSRPEELRKYLKLPTCPAP